MLERAEFIKSMMKHAWSNYKKYAWGADHLRPLSKKPMNAHKGPLAFTLVDSLDTLLLMDLTDEFNEARDYVINEMDLDAFINQDVDISFFETTIRVLGGFLAAHDVAVSRGDEIVEKTGVFIEKAKMIADRLLVAFDTPTGMPNNCINLKTGRHTLPGWSQGYANMAEIGTNILEFARLSQLSGDPKYERAARKSLTFVDQVVGAKLPIHGLYPIYASVIDGSLRNPPDLEYTVGACADSFFEYLLKMWIQSGKRDERYGKMFDAALDGIKQHILKQNDQGLYYLPSGRLGHLNAEMQHLTCFAGGMFALNVISGKSRDPQHDTLIAAKLTETGYLMYARNPLFLGPEVADMNDSKLKPFHRQRAYLQRPEVVESIFYMWRLTHDNKYREWNWNIAQAIEKYTRVECGYSGLYDVDKEKSFNDIQDSYFLAETLKYLYLTFCDDNVLPLHKWVLTTEAHPLCVNK